MVSKLKVGKNTAITVDGTSEDFKKGIGIIDDKGKPHEIISIGLVSEIDKTILSNQISLLIQGKFNSKKLYI